MATLHELRLMTRVARLYYERGLTQSEIADQLSLSQATVSRLLKRAHQEQIARITVNMPHRVYTDLEEALQKSYGLKDAVVADAEDDADNQVLRAIGAAAAYYVETTLGEGEIVGISSRSDTLVAMVDALQGRRPPRGVKVVQILGGLGDPADKTHASLVTRRLADALRAEAVYLPAPGLVGSSTARDLLLADSAVGAVMRRMAELTLALTGIGTADPDRLLARNPGVLGPKDVRRLRRAGATGDICLRFFDAKGVPSETSVDGRIIGIDLERLAAIPRTVAVAGGRLKYAAIRAALLGGWVNVLVTDCFTARWLLEAPT